MSRLWQTYEDPDYYVEDDEVNWQDMEDLDEDQTSDTYSPYNTVNS
jgi:hypothetical protein